MPRADLLALTDEDLAALTNRGTVKRAQKELESDDPKYEVSEDDHGGVTVSWSDGVTCRFLAGKSIHDARCSSGVAGISRHIVRSVLAYQRVHAGAKPEAQTSETQAHGPPAPAPAVWDPGTISDDELTACFKKQAVAKARTRFEQGVLVELTRGAKPTARFLDEACTVRFAVPGDLRYATADCAESLWPLWIALAVWAFRELPADQLAGLVSMQRTTWPVPADLFREAQSLLDELGRDGIAGIAPTWSQRLQRIEHKLRDKGLVWPAELALELAQQFEMYQAHDARFDPDHVVLLVGELIVRMRAIARGVTAVPIALIRGTPSDRPTEIGSGRFTGVGLGIHAGRRHTTLRSYLQDANTGAVVAVERTFADPDPKSGAAPKSFEELAGTVLVRGATMGTLAASQLLVQSGKRTPGGILILPRLLSSLTVHPQSFQWENLKPPFAVEGFAQLRARLRFLPPSYLRPRRATENLHGVPVAGVEQVQFDAARQTLTAALRDSQGATAALVHGFHYRGAAGFNALAEALTNRGDRIRFVCGHVRASSTGLVIHPVLLIDDDGTRRIGINPWLATRTGESGGRDGPATMNVIPRSDAEGFLTELHASLAEVMLSGVVRDAAHARTFAERAEQSRRLGFVQIAEAIARLAEELAARDNTLRWDAAAAVGQILNLCAIARIAAE